MADLQEQEHWSRMLKQARSNLERLREQDSFYAEGEKRLAYHNQMVAEQDNIRRCKAQLRTLGFEPSVSSLDPPEELVLFSPAIINTYPLPIAEACAEFNLAADDTERFVALDRLATYLIKYLAALFIGHARRDKLAEYPIPERLEWMGRPNLEHWAAALYELSQLYGQKPWCDLWQLGNLHDACTRLLVQRQELLVLTDYLTVQVGEAAIQEPSVVDLLRLLGHVATRQWDSQPASYERERRAALMLLLQPALRILLNELEALRRYPLVYVEKADQLDAMLLVRAVRFMGRETQEIDTTMPLVQPVAVAEARHIKRQRLYISADDGPPLIDMHPFFVLYRWKLFVLQYQQRNDFVEYRACRGSKCFRPPSEARTYYASWWKEHEHEEAPAGESEMPPVLGEDERWHDHVDVIASDGPGDPVSLTQLSVEGRQALEIAFGEALRIGHTWLGVDALLMGLSKQTGCAFSMLLDAMQVNPRWVRGMLRGNIGVRTDQEWKRQDVLRLGAEALPHSQIIDPSRFRQAISSGTQPGYVITQRIARVLEQAAVLADQDQIGHNHLLQALFSEPNWLTAHRLYTLMDEVGWPTPKLLRKLAELMGESPAPDVAAPGIPPLRVRLSPPVDNTLLQRLGLDLNQAALDGDIGEAYGAQAHQAITQIAQILSLREANNPILLGEPGVGKTVIVEGLAWRLAGLGRPVKATLAGKRVIELSTVDLLSGTALHGDLEERMKQLLSEVKQAKDHVIVFIDEIHTLLGGERRSSTIVNALKPALGRGEFPCIGATTVEEYRRHIEKDPALARRFTPIWIEEADVDTALEIVSQVARGRLSQHHGVTFDSDAVVEAVKLSARYLYDRRLPGKAIKVLDQAASSLQLNDTISEFSTPARGAAGTTVQVDTVHRVIAQQTSIPVEQLGKTDRQRLNELEGRLKAQVKGQHAAIAEVTRVLRRAGAGLTDPRRPLGVFLFTGPTGVGKTQLALAMAAALFDKEDAIFRLDMSEFMEKHHIARLVGAPPGYIGYDEEGQLIAHLRRRPYSIVLLDEMVKAHPDVQHLFLQLFDTGRLTDARGYTVDARNTIFVMTTNLTTREKLSPKHGERSIEDHFSPEFRNRIDCIVSFAQLDEEALAAVLRQELTAVKEHVMQQGITIVAVTDAAQRLILVESAAAEGARAIRRSIERLIIDSIADLMLNSQLQSGDRVLIDVQAGRINVEIINGGHR